MKFKDFISNCNSINKNFLDKKRVNSLTLLFPFIGFNFLIPINNMKHISMLQMATYKDNDLVSMYELLSETVYILKAATV